MKQKLIDTASVAANAVLMFFFPFHPVVMFAAGYTARHLIQHVFERVFKRHAKQQPKEEIDVSDLRDSIMSFNGGKTWYVRTEKGGNWIGVSMNFIQKILDHYATNTDKNAAQQSADSPGTEAQERQRL